MAKGFLRACLAASALVLGMQGPLPAGPRYDVVLKPTDAEQQRIDQDYGIWSAKQSELAGAELQQRLGEDTEVRRQIQINSDYARWEADRTAVAANELNRRTELAREAADLLVKAQQAAEEARARADAADEANRVAAEQEASRLEQAALDQEAATARARELEDAARAQAELEAQAQQQAEAEAIANRYAESAPVEVQTMDPVTMWVTSTVNVRTGPGTMFAKQGQLNAGAAVTVNGQANGFYRLDSGQFVAMQYLTETGNAPAAPESPAAPQGDAGNPVYTFSTWVANIDDQAAVDQCTGGLTYSPPISDYVGKPYYPMHNHCGGLPILSLQAGDTVHIEGVGVFTVVGSKDVTQGDSAEALLGLPGDALIQTCYSTGNKMRVVELASV